MAEFDFISILVPSLIAGGISFTLLAINKFSKTSEGTLTGTIRLEHVSTGLTNVEDKLDEILKRINEMDRTVYNNSYRLDRLERIERNGNHK